MPNNAPPPADAAQTDDCCGLCDLTYFDIALDHLEEHWDNPKGLMRSIRELFEDRYEQYAKPLVWRMEKISPAYPGFDRLRQAVNDRIFWGRRVTSPPA